MQLFLPTYRIKVLLVILLVILGVGSYIYNQYLIGKIQEQEMASIELLARAFEFTSNPVHNQVSEDLNGVINTLRSIPQVPDSLVAIIEGAEAMKSSLDFVRTELIIKQHFQVPQILVDESGGILFHNHIDEEDVGLEMIQYLASIHDPISITLGHGLAQQTQYFYYGESQTVQYLRYFPYIQLGLLAMLLGVGYTTYRSITRSEQSNLWVGMAKEAAHQLGTPISSLYGWVELLKDKEGKDEKSASHIREIENDIARLRGIAERFNKIGSEPELRNMRIVPIVDQVISYMERRLPQIGKHVEVRRSVNTDARVNVNPELFQWAIENLLKNSMDAIRENHQNAYVSIQINQIEDEVFIDVEDSGSGIDKKYISEIFKPGFSTKKRGWGLGLSLTRRIIEEYHNGSLSILRSEPDKGTTVRITLKI